MRVEIEVDDFVYAARTMYAEVADPLTMAVHDLGNALAATGSMAGDDPTGLAWASNYDRAARAALAADQDVINGCYRLSTMFGQSARNYEYADVSSTAASRHRMAASTATLPDQTQVSFPLSVPTAAGGSGQVPWSWVVIAPLLSLLWPDGHQDRLRVAAKAWATSADTIDEHSGRASLAAVAFPGDAVPESDDMLVVCAAMTDHLRALAQAHRSLATACEVLAHHLDVLHHEVIQELERLAEWTAAIEGGGALLSAVTLGAAEGPTQDVEVTRIAITAVRVGQMIAEFIDLASHAADAVLTIENGAQAVSTRMKDLLHVPLAIAGVSTVPGLPVAATTTPNADSEKAASERLAVTASVWIRSIPRDQVTRAQVEKKYGKHATDFGVTAPRGRDGFGQFEASIRRLVDDPATLRTAGFYRGEPAVLNFNPTSRLLVVQYPDGRLWTCFRMSDQQLRRAVIHGRVGIE